MKKILFIFFILPTLINAQIYKAGTQFSNYIDIIPDTLINYSCPYSPLESYNIDVNADSQNDFEISAKCIDALGGGGKRINITPLNAHSYTRFGRYDSIYDNYVLYWRVTKVAKPLYSGDTINSATAKWDSLGLSLTNNSWGLGGSINIYDWVSTNDLYIGIKYQDVSSVIYGWLRVNLPGNNKCFLKDYSFSVCSLCVGIREYNLRNIKIYPNPSSTSLHIESDQFFENSEIEIINSLGQLILKLPYANSIDVAQLSTGFYSLKIVSQNKETYNYKFIKN